MPTPSDSRNKELSSLRPVSVVTRTNSHASTPVNARHMSVDSSATFVAGPKPWAR